MRVRTFVAWACAGWTGVSHGATVRVRVVDEATGQPVPARAYLLREGKPVLPKGFPSYDRGDERHFLVPGEFELDLEPGKSRLRIERGLEYAPAELDLDPSAGTTVSVRLHRWIDMNREGWYSADMHVHRDPEAIPAILRAEDLNFVPTITTHVWSNDVNQPWKARSEFPIVVEPGHRLF